MGGGVLVTKAALERLPGASPRTAVYGSERRSGSTGVAHRRRRWTCGKACTSDPERIVGAAPRIGRQDRAGYRHFARAGCGDGAQSLQEGRDQARNTQPHANRGRSHAASSHSVNCTTVALHRIERQWITHPTGAAPRPGPASSRSEASAYARHEDTEAATIGALNRLACSRR